MPTYDEKCNDYLATGLENGVHTGNLQVLTGLVNLNLQHGLTTEEAWVFAVTCDDGLVD